MNIYKKSRIEWSCHRGMLELDIILIPFAKHKYDLLSNFDKNIFIKFLKNNDSDLFNWIMGYSNPTNLEFKKIIKIIKKYHLKQII